MRFPHEVLFAACKSAGMLESAVYAPASASPVPFDVQWVRPEQLVLGDEAISAEYQIEYETAAVPPVKHHDPIQVGLVLYRARQPAQVQGDGYFSRCQLELV